MQIKYRLSPGFAPATPQIVRNRTDNIAPLRTTNGEIRTFRPVVLSAVDAHTTLADKTFILRTCDLSGRFIAFAADMVPFVKLKAGHDQESSTLQYRGRSGPNWLLFFILV